MSDILPLLPLGSTALFSHNSHEGHLSAVYPLPSMTQPTPTTVASKRHVDSSFDGDHAMGDTVTTGSYSEENYRKLKRKLKEIMLVK
jgi:hypothetical protein